MSTLLDDKNRKKTSYKMDVLGFISKIAKICKILCNSGVVIYIIVSSALGGVRE